MKVTKYVHSCLLVETPDRTAVFDPGMMSESSFPVDQLKQLDDIIITHEHGDHFSPSFIQSLLVKFPGVLITAPTEVVVALAKLGISATDNSSPGIEIFDSPHESVEPMYPQPEEIGVHYMDQLTHPGDSHSFSETKAILALPMTGPWGTSVKALKIALKLKPEYIVPIHDWHWRDEARMQTYDHFETILKAQGITFLKPETGLPLDIDL